MKSIIKCPHCGSIDIDEIVHDEYYIPDCTPSHRCNTCKKGIGSKPLFRDIRGVRDYRNEVSMISYERFFDCYSAHSFVTIQKHNGSYYVEAAEYSKNSQKENQNSITFNYRLNGEQWKRIVDTIFKESLLHEWEPDDTDYSQSLAPFYEFTVQCELNREFRFSWDNTNEPPYFLEIDQLFSDLMHSNLV